MFEEIPLWALDIEEQKNELQVKARLDDAWRDQELAVIADQLMALEERDAGVEAEDVRPGSRVLWLTYRSAVRNWSGSNDSRPERPV
ncbi:hypothetical protein ACP3PM_17890 [Pseudomonas iridis]